MVTNRNPYSLHGRNSPLENGPSLSLVRGDGTRYSIDTRDNPTSSEEAFDVRAAVCSSLGKELREARQRKGLNLSQVSGSLKISKRHINAIEEGEVDVLPPGKVYLIGYTRAYAGYLGLNVAKCVEKLKVEIAEREDSCGIIVAESSSRRTQPRSAIGHVLSLVWVSLGFSDAPPTSS
jgi:transcriptional regulator with XRE-family HTH domain